MNVTDPVRRVSVVSTGQDHIGGLAELSQADIVVSQAEWDTLSAPLPEMRGLMRRHIDLPGQRWHKITAEPAGDSGLAPFRSCHDLFGDGSLVLLPTPGHTPGSMSLLVRRPGRPPLIMVGDVTYDAHLLEGRPRAWSREPAPPARSHRHDQQDAPAVSGAGDPARA